MSGQIIDKDVSKKIQGIAVLMMIVHHAFGFPERYLSGISYIGIPIGGGILKRLSAQCARFVYHFLHLEPVMVWQTKQWI